MNNHTLTDAEWCEFQSIPEEGYSHRAWVDARIRERTLAAIERVEAVLNVATDDLRYDTSYGADGLGRLIDDLRAALAQSAPTTHPDPTFPNPTQEPNQ